MRTTLVVVCCTLFCTIRAKASVIDDFDTGEFYVSTVAANPVTLSQTGLETDHVLGGTRDVSLTRTGSLESAAAVLSLDYLAWSNDAYTYSVLTIEYGKNTELNAVLSDSSEFRLSAKTDSASLPKHQMDITISIMTGGNQFTVPAGSVATNDIFVDVIIPFSNFTGPVGTPDWEDVDYIKLMLTTPNAGTDAAIDEFTVQIPEPTTTAFLAPGALGLIRRRRKLAAAFRLRLDGRQASPDR